MKVRSAGPVRRTSAVSRPTRLARRAGLAIVALALVAAGCSSDGDTASRSSSPRASEQHKPIDGAQSPSGAAELEWSRCAEVPAGECATLTVPLDWDKPQGETIDLALGRIRATGDRLGSVVMNPGGPGASGLDLLRNNPLSPALTGRFDSVSWDPRGVGSSTALTCGKAVPEMLSLDPDPDSAAEQSALNDAAQAVSSECAKSDAKLLAHVSTDDVARDLEAIRIALGDGQLNYLGFSYGTDIGQEYAQLHPDKIRAMVLDGVVDPTEGFEEFLLGQTRAFDASFERNVTACSKAGVKRCGVKNLGSAYDRIAKQVDKTPLGSGSTEVGPAELATAAIMSAYWSDGWTRLGPALADALDGDPAELRRLADTYTDLSGYTAYAAVVCTDSPPPEGDAAYEQFADELRKVSPRLGGSIANELLPCATWPVKATGKPQAITAEGAPPILVIGNTGDPATPYANAQRVAESLSSGVLVTADIAGHTAYGTDSCVTKVVDSYLVDLVVPKRDPNCR